MITENSGKIFVLMSLLEEQLGSVQEILVSGEFAELVEATHELQRQTLELLGQMAQTQLDAKSQKNLKQRVKIVVLSFPMIRQALQRKAAAVDRALQILIPASHNATYGAAAFASVPRSTGEFQSFSA